MGNGIDGEFPAFASYAVAVVCGADLDDVQGYEGAETRERLHQDVLLSG